MRYLALEEHTYVVKQKNDLQDYLYEGLNTNFSDPIAMKVSRQHYEINMYVEFR